jgi:hypothetical protein
MSPDVPVIHTSQSIKWYRPLPVPRIRKNGNSRVDESMKANLDARTISIVPKSIGTFVTAETDIACYGSLICTLLSTNLVLGTSPEDVIPYEPAVTRKQYRIPSKLRNVAPVFEWRYQTIPAQALLYRIASGDSNFIHVDASVVPRRGGEASTRPPLLHGLCTVGIVRAIMQYLTSIGCTSSLIQLDLRLPILII